MDVELQILKHLARYAHSRAPVVDEYCGEYKDLFKEVRTYATGTNRSRLGAAQPRLDTSIVSKA
jgi:hypothetical protein